MKRFSVYVERLVPQWTRVVVAAESEERVQQKSQKIYESACQERTDWEYEDSASEPSCMEVTEIPTEDYHEFDEPMMTIGVDSSRLTCSNCSAKIFRNKMLHVYPDIPNIIIPNLMKCPECGARVHDAD